MGQTARKRERERYHVTQFTRDIYVPVTRTESLRHARASLISVTRYDNHTPAGAIYSPDENAARAARLIRQWVSSVPLDYSHGSRDVGANKSVNLRDP